ncbi:hypothetical protein AOC36_03465 [Erysipelothrix larvae]|uniref:ABC3 transporter permease C-terminal domain-containing protein n=1 Tax=Erysipelothrix larvae TaxID=1514105 RepID=A0A0X8GZ33_9FIRM|nr:ABC transporter permease [Erysipelothrix larvae]AMC93067.1 hypothetical protein AOC36_03465 [Erysipelothrix larvae]
MVKDTLREIKRKLFQFFAIAIIIFLGVGFYIGIQVTGYNMRLTGDTYMEDKNMFDTTLIHTLGIDETMIEDLQKVLGGEVVGVVEEDMFVKGNAFDDVMHVIEYSNNTADDLTLIEGKLPTQPKEVVVDSLMAEFSGFKLGDTLTLHKESIFESQDVTIVGFVESSLYMNMERGNSSLGSGTVRGFLYGSQLGKASETLLYTSVRIQNATVKSVENTLNKEGDVLSDGRFNRLIQPKIDELVDAQQTLNENQEKANREFAKAQAQLDSAQAQLDSAKGELEKGLDDLAGMTLIGSLDERLMIVKGNYQRAKTLIEESIVRIETQIETVESNEVKEFLSVELKQAKQELNTINAQYGVGLKEVEAGISAYHTGEAQLETNRTQFETEKLNTQKQLENGQAKIDEGYKQIEKTAHGSFIVRTRQESIIGYREFYDDSYRIENIGKVFPVIFFGVAILVTLSTISRMIDESRMQIGVYKALGYSSLKIAMKYVLFSGFAWIIGSIGGMFFGFMFIPSIIYNAYRIMYQTPDLVAGFVWQYASLPLFLSFLSSVGVAFYKSMRTTTEKSANLLRPLAPKQGQRVFLERIPSLWNRMSFLVKVSIRNLFRNKTRFLMTIIGIGGCCGLLITGFGLKHSIYSIVDLQFDKIINYDGIAAYDAFDIDPALFTDYVTSYVTSIKVDNSDVSLYASDDLEHLGDFIVFNDIETKTPVEIDENSVLVSQKLASLLGVKRGDAVDFTYEGQSISLKITNIVENYANHYIYLNYNMYESVMNGTEPSNFVTFKTDLDSKDVGSKLLESSHVLTVQFLEDISETYREMMGSFDIVIVVIVACALALEVIVLMNLISMNMSERQKELATLKVLGFYPKELASYVLRENIILTLISLVFGVIFGRFLHLFVVEGAEIDKVLFNREILWSSYALAIAITFGLSILLNLFMARKANHVNMSEALKTFDS